MSTHTFEPGERTARGFFLAPVEQHDSEDRTAVEPIVESGSTYLVGDSSDHAVFTADMLEELRRRLRDAEAREASGVRPCPTEEELEIEVEVELDEPGELGSLEGVLGALPELEVALAPNSDSNFYAGFDDEHPDGVFVATYSQLAVGAPVYVTVHLPGGYRFRSAAMVEWARSGEACAPGLPVGIGLSLCGLDLPTRRLIRSFVRHRKPMFYLG